MDTRNAIDEVAVRRAQDCEQYIHPSHREWIENLKTSPLASLISWSIHKAAGDHHGTGRFAKNIRASDAALTTAKIANATV
jgi:hypothetical protein